MERENKKRGREQAGEDRKDLGFKTSKKHHYDRNINFRVEAQDESKSNVLLSDKYLAFGVFDFPWLHEEEGMISKSSEEWNFQDTFSSSLEDISMQYDQVELFSRQSLYEIPDNKFQQNVWPFKGGEEEEELEIGNVDCMELNDQQDVVPNE